jgi:hypothetical protein
MPKFFNAKTPRVGREEAQKAQNKAESFNHPPSPKAALAGQADFADGHGSFQIEPVSVLTF